MMLLTWMVDLTRDGMKPMRERSPRRTAVLDADPVPALNARRTRAGQATPTSSWLPRRKGRTRTRSATRRQGVAKPVPVTSRRRIDRRWPRAQSGEAGAMDEIPVKKAVNTVKASVNQRRGPVRKDQDAVPIADAMRDYWERGMLTFGIPAHNGGRGPAPEFTRWLGADVARCDLPMSHGMDTRDRAWGVVSTAQELFAEAVGSKQTLFSTNGSSMSVHVAMMTVVGPGETLVIARNGHKSSFAGLVLSGARPVYLDPYYDEDLEIAEVQVPADL